VANILRDPTGLPFSVAAVSERENVKLSPVDPQQVVSQNVAFELAERSAGVKYPIVYVYCEKITNQLREKFRTFSGKARIAIDVRVSQDRLNGIEGQLAMYVEAVTDILDTRRGDWGQGMFYTGGYEVSFSATKHGGKNFIQTAKVTFDVDISSN
jgi:hypothetical protein